MNARRVEHKAAAAAGKLVGLVKPIFRLTNEGCGSKSHYLLFAAMRRLPGKNTLIT